MVLGGEQTANRLGDVAVLVPAWQPDARLPALVEALGACGFGSIVVVDDGSGPEFDGVFEGLRGVDGVRVLRQARNMGKGCALKTGMGFVLGEMPGVVGVVTADADGQHAVADVVRVAEVLRDGEAVIGVRRFTGDVPLRCRVGNALTRRIFGALTGVRVSDTQTGLRGFPMGMLAELAMLRGERYEYEMVVLARLCRSGARPVEVAIETVYLEGNRSSHFRPVRDSVRILVALVRSVLRG
jgi:glycosyltransferase involved in cell wall biosynthesis